MNERLRRLTTRQSERFVQLAHEVLRKHYLSLHPLHRMIKAQAVQVKRPGFIGELNPSAIVFRRVLARHVRNF